MYYKNHLFFCTNDRNDGRACCQDHDAQSMRQYAKDKAKSLGLAVEGGARVNTAGCLGRCKQGPVAVVYPEGVWYSYTNREDIDEIVDEHLLNGRVVDRLKIPE